MDVVNMQTEDWAEYCKKLKNSIANIHIPNDVNPPVAINIISRIDHLYSNLRIQFSELESTKERIDTMIKEIERVGLKGSNEHERKRNAVMAVIESTDDNEMSLYDIQRETNERYNFIRGVIDVLMAKQARLITINGLLKLEKELIGGTDSWAKMPAPV